MNNIPNLKQGIVAVSRDCFPVELSRKRRNAVVSSCEGKGIPVIEVETIVENENDVIRALKEIEEKEINSLVVYLGNFGPEGPTTLLAQKFNGPVMFAAAAEESGHDLVQGRGDAFCGLLSVSYNLGLRNLHPYIPEHPVGTACGVAGMIEDFSAISRIQLGLAGLKIFSFGPRPYDFLACNAPIKPLFDLGVEIMENSELDLYDIYLSAEGDPRIEDVAGEMAAELGEGDRYPDLLKKLARYEIALMQFMDDNLGASEFGIFANKCWPSFEKYFGFVPCYVNSRLASRNIPVSCEVDIYGTLSEYIIACASQVPPTLLDINNTVPEDMYAEAGSASKEYRRNELFMGFHCGNTPSSCMTDCSMRYQLIMHRLLEPDVDPDITRGTLEGRIRPGEVTLFRLHSGADTHLQSYMAEGEILDIDPKSFGSIGVFAVPELDRFYRHVLIEKRFPHHAGVGFAHIGKPLFEAMKLLGVNDISYNQPKERPYQTENPFT